MKVVKNQSPNLRIRPVFNGWFCLGWLVFLTHSFIKKSPNGGIVSTPLPFKLVYFASPSRHLD